MNDKSKILEFPKKFANGHNQGGMGPSSGGGNGSNADTAIALLQKEMEYTAKKEDISKLEIRISVLEVKLDSIKDTMATKAWVLGVVFLNVIPCAYVLIQIFK